MNYQQAKEELSSETIEVVCAAFEIDPADLRAGARRTVVSMARTMTCVILEEHGLTVSEIARLLGRDRTMVYRCINRMHFNYMENTAYMRVLEKMS